MTEPRVEHEPGRFVVHTAEGDATLVYRMIGDVLDVEHTWTPPALRGRNLAAALTAAAFAHAQPRQAPPDRKSGMGRRRRSGSPSRRLSTA